MENSPATQTAKQKANLPKAVVDAIAAKSPATFAPGVTPDQVEQYRINPMQQPVQAPNPMMPNRAGAPPRSMNDLVYQPLSNQGSMAYQKGKTPTKGGVGGVSNSMSTDELIKRIQEDNRNRRSGTELNSSPEGKKGKLMSGEPLKPGDPDYIPPANREKPGTTRFSDTKTLSDSTLKKMEKGKYYN